MKRKGAPEWSGAVPVTGTAPSPTRPAPATATGLVTTATRLTALVTLSTVMAKVCESIVTGKGGGLIVKGKDCDLSLIHI